MKVAGAAGLFRPGGVVPMRSVAAALDVPVFTVRGVLPSLPILRLARQCKSVFWGLFRLNAVTERFREGARDVCPPWGAPPVARFPSPCRDSSFAAAKPTS